MAYSPNVDYRAEARKAARRHGLDPNVFERQIGVESIGYSPAVISGRQSSPKGAQGIAQIMPDTARAWGVDPLHPVKALDAAARAMAGYVRQFGSYEAALRAYNAGPGNVAKSHGFAETNSYVAKILHGHDPGRLSAPASGPDGGSGVSGGNGAQAPAQGRQGVNLGQGSTLTAGLAAALQAASAQVQPSVAVSAPVLPAFAAQPKLAGPAAPSVDPRASGGPDLKGLLSTVLASGDQTQTPGGAAAGGGQQAGGGGQGAQRQVGRTLVVGDSLGVGTLPVLQRLLGGRVTGDVKVGRASPEGVKVLAQKLRGGGYENIVFDQGTNDVSATELRKSLAQVRRLAPHARILIPTLNGPFATPAKNAVLHVFAQGDPNVKLVPWHSLSQNGLLGPDSTHATPVGYSKRAQLIARELGWAPSTPTLDGRRGRVIVAAGANRRGVVLQPVVTNLVSKIAGAWGKPLTIGTGSNHNQFVQGRPGVQSDHWMGHAADIPASGSTLTRLGQTALVVAGMSPAQARKAKGGVYNLTVNGRRVQIIFNTDEGGDHYNHLHVGVR